MSAVVGHHSAWAAHRTQACGGSCFYCGLRKKIQRSAPLMLLEFRGKNRADRWEERKAVKRERRVARLAAQLAKVAAMKKQREAA